MLDGQALWLGKWSSTGGGRAIVDAATRQPLGAARWRAPTGPSWLRWCKRPTLEVVEAPDDSLLLHVRQRWLDGRTWEVRDADDRVLGLVSRREAFDGRGRRVVALDQGFFRGEDGQVLATWNAVDDGRVTAFAAGAENPFVKMLLLAVLLQAEE